MSAIDEHSVFYVQIIQEADHNLRSAENHYDRAWIFTMWHDFDVKYPFVKELHYLRCIIIVLL